MAAVTLPQMQAVMAQQKTSNAITKSSSTTIRSFDGLHCQGAKCGGVKAGRRISSLSLKQVVRERVGTRKARVVCAVGDVSDAGNTYLIAGAVAIALIGTALPFVFSRKDTCPECGGAGFVRGSNVGALKANAARKDQAQIVCRTCNGLGKLGQIDK
ncbi:unnamed protein product [Calypogeia fissa]